ncbi:hypothetical protein [Lysinibacillus fusiformis]|uniref:hypothetical protein n=1 Tax=Lysinibacillus fusiformis TaxID=28031 RepID=UPI001247ACF4|nr:hypothetical protein [Lysinibacillus fusiformis]KAB0442124.1 hypothetical protein CH314_19165 [Lysinibacillus fusiformis]
MTETKEINWSEDIETNLFYNQKTPTLDLNYSITENVNFNNDFWDFSEFNTLHNGGRNKYQYNFSIINHQKYKLYLKNMVLRELFVKRNRFTTTYTSFRCCVNFIKYLESTHIYLPIDIRPSTISSFFENRNIQQNTKQHELISLKKFLQEIEIDNKDFPITNFYKIFSSANKKSIRTELENGKTNNIPRNLFNKIIQVALKQIDNKEIDVLDRMISCFILILSQVGMRIGEASLLEIDKIKEIEILNGKKKSYIMEFLTYKTTHQSNGRLTETVMTDIALKAYNTLQELSRERRGRNSKALFPNSKGGFISSKSLAQHIQRFFYKNQSDLAINSLSSNELKLLEYFEPTLEKYEYFRKCGFRKTDVETKIFYATSHQFRVAVCNEFKRFGVTLQWIKEHMNHLTEEMTKHYFRSDENEITLLRDTLLKRSSKTAGKLTLVPSEIDDTKIRAELEDEQFIAAYKEINKFLNKRSLNIFVNLDEILEIFKDYPLRESELGLCTKALGKLCARQERLTTLENWYYLKPQIASVSQFDLTYRRFIDKVKIIEHNEKVKDQDSRYLLQYNLEKKSLKSFLHNKVLPELKLIETEILKNGKKSLEKQNPNLKSILMDIDKIKKDCENWIIRLNL